MKAFLELLAQRVKERDNLDLWYVLSIVTLPVGGIYFWLLPIDDGNIGAAVVAGTIAAIAQMPVFVTFIAVQNKIRFSPTTRIVADLATIVIASWVFIACYYELSPANYSSRYVSWLNGWLNQTVAAIYLFAGYAFLRGSFEKYRTLTTEYQGLRLKLKELKTNSLSRLELENRELQQKAQTALLPAITEIQAELANSRHEYLVVAEKIQDTLKNTVKPLGQSLRVIFDDEQIAANIDARYVKPWGAIPFRFNPRDTFSPSFIVWFWLPVSILASLTLTERPSLMILFAELFITWLIMLLVRLLLPNRKLHFSFSIGLQIIAVLGPVTVVTLLFKNSFINEAGPLMFVAWVAYSYGALIELALDRSTKAAAALTEQLQSAKEAVSQKLWIAKRNWSYLIHGRVQAHMLAAQLLAGKGNLTVEQVSKIKHHFDEILEVLKFPPMPDVDLVSELNDLEVTWSGVAKIEFEFDIDALAVLDQDSALRFAINEISKEAVSNAVKHAKADEVAIRVSLDQGDLLFKAQNNGDKPTKNSRVSLGAEMLSELCRDWSLDYDSKNQIVTLSARLALTQN